MVYMIVVIIAGGSGTRLWPLSTPDYPKHLLKVNGSEKSLLQSTYERAKTLANDVYVITDGSHAHHVKSQLPDLPDEAFITEPARRGTASCIVAGLERISKNHEANEAIAFWPADHYVRDVAGFQYSFEAAGQAAEENGRIILVGVEPDYPATGFGYIEKGKVFDSRRFVFEVNAFKEKPAYDLAQKYVKSGNYLWNCGYFVGTLQTFLDSMAQYAPELRSRYDALFAAMPDTYQDVYLGFENVAIDYALIEKVPNLLVVPAAFDWLDLGSFGDLHKAVGGDENGNYSTGNVEIEEVENSYIHNEDEKPVAVIGLDNVVIINSPNGLLVARKDLAQKVGDVSKRIQSKKEEA